MSKSMDKRIQMQKEHDGIPQNIPPLDWHELLSVEETLSEADNKALTDYFTSFALPPKDENGKVICLGCKRPMLGGLEAAILGGAPDRTSLEWGIANGEAHCHKCGYPYRVYHRDIGGVGDAAAIKFLSLSLPYHPSSLKETLND